MNTLHDYVKKQLAERVNARRVVVWYDPRSEFTPFVDELRASAKPGKGLPTVTLGGTRTRLAHHAGSFLEVRAQVEPHVRGDTPEPVVIYVPGQERDRRGSLLLELEQAGDCWEPQLRRLARNVLRLRYTDGVIDDLLAPASITWTDLARAAASTSSTTPPSVLKAIFHDTRDTDGLLACWLASDAKDAEVEAKAATPELGRLVRSRLGLELPEGAEVAKLRAIVLRYVLGNEFRADLACPPPPNVATLPAPPTKDEAKAVRTLAVLLRSDYAAAYPALADRVETELGLTTAKLTPGALGAIDTFRFEERALLGHCWSLVASQRFDAAIELVAGRERSFWLDREVGRKAQWEAARRMAVLGKLASTVRTEVAATRGDANTWVEAYTAKEGWHRLDQAQRQLEAWVVNLDDEPDERPLGVVRRAHEEACHAMAEGFTAALVKSGWTAAASLHQTHVFSDVVTGQPKPVAYFLVDAMRYEMGVELGERLPRTAEVSVRHALGALPSITPIGMAALQPGAAGSFSVVEQRDKLGGRIGDAFLPDLAARKKFAASRVPNLVDLGLDELLSLPASKLAKKVEGAQVIVVRSQEIDDAGEKGFTYQARQVMDTVIDNLARAVRKLAAAGVEHSVLSADHGHLFFASDRDESMRTDSPGGAPLELHRRCWIGRGGSTPPGCVRVTAAALGYDSDLDFVFPRGCGVFKAGGDLAFHHGGPSLQELLVPVLTVRMKVREAAPASETLTVTGLPDAVTNRIFSVVLLLGAEQLGLASAPVVVRPLLMSESKNVGAVGMVVEGVNDSGRVTLVPGKPTTVVFIISEVPASLRVVILDPTTDAELYRSPADIPVRLGV